MSWSYCREEDGLSAGQPPTKCLIVIDLGDDLEHLQTTKG